MKKRRSSQPLRTSSTVRSSDKRTRSIVIKLNAQEHHALQQYCMLKRVSNRSRLLREIIMAEVIGGWESCSPMLFSEEEMR